MKIGDYVRTPKGIGKINQMYSDRTDSFIYLDCGITIDYITKDFSEDEINKMYPSSPNKIDLIEVGDYVNGCKIIELATNIDGKVLYLETDITEFDNVYACGHINIYENDIRSIVTKEQFSQMEYKVGDD